MMQQAGMLAPPPATEAKPEVAPMAPAQETPVVSEALVTETMAAESPQNTPTPQTVFEPKAEEGNA
jgi:hypothetical protein